MSYVSSGIECISCCHTEMPFTWYFIFTEDEKCLKITEDPMGREVEQVDPVKAREQIEDFKRIVFLKKDGMMTLDLREISMEDFEKAKTFIKYGDMIKIIHPDGTEICGEWIGYIHDSISIKVDENQTRLISK